LGGAVAVVVVAVVAAVAGVAAVLDAGLLLVLAPVLEEALVELLGPRIECCECFDDGDDDDDGTFEERMNADIKVENKTNTVIKEKSVAKQERQQPLPASLPLAASFFVEGASDASSSFSFSFSSLISPFFSLVAFSLAFLVAAMIPSRVAVAVEEELLMLNGPSLI